MVVALEEKSRVRIVAGADQGDDYKRTIDEVSKRLSIKRSGPVNFILVEKQMLVYDYIIFCIEIVYHGPMSL